jgi:hypothetical protein
MRRFVLWGLLLAGAVIIGASLWWQWMYPVAQFRYKLTVEVMTPDGLKSGSSVIEVSYRDVYSLSGVPNLRLTARGEAVFIPVGGSRLFAVTLTDWESGRSSHGLRSSDLEIGSLRGALDVHALPLKVLGLSWKNYDENLLMQQINSSTIQKRRFPVPFANLPTLVVFEDVNNPDSVEVVQPDNLSDVLGVGYALTDVWLELTDGQPTNSEMKQLPWWEAKVAEQMKLHSLGRGQTLINNILDSAFRRPGIWGNNK